MNKKNIAIGIVLGALVLTLPWLNYEFRLRVCEVFGNAVCINTFPSPEGYEDRIAKEWKAKTGKSMKDF